MKIGNYTITEAEGLYTVTGTRASGYELDGYDFPTLEAAAGAALALSEDDMKTVARKEARARQDMEDRKKAVLAMEFLARQINDEAVFEGWLMTGVADGDIEYGSVDLDQVDDYYTEPENFAELMDCFLRRMSAARKSGGLYCGGVVSGD